MTGSGRFHHSLFRACLTSLQALLSHTRADAKTASSGLSLSSSSPARLTAFPGSVMESTASRTGNRRSLRASSARRACSEDTSATSRIHQANASLVPDRKGLEGSRQMGRTWYRAPVRQAHRMPRPHIKVPDTHMETDREDSHHPS
jgi:hypothetical protein